MSIMPARVGCTKNWKMISWESSQQTVLKQLLVFYLYEFKIGSFEISDFYIASQMLSFSVLKEVNIK